MNASTSSVGAADRGRLDARVAVVTGAAGGIGSAIALGLAQRGARVALLDLPQHVADLTRTAAAWPVPGIAVACDIADAASVAEAARSVQAGLGGAAILVNNAGILGPHGALEDFSLDVFDRVMTINLRGALLCTQAFGAHMLAAGRGAIVNIGSIAASRPNATPAYSISKAALLALGRHTAVEWGPRGVRTNTVSPGFVQTALSAGHYASTDLLQVRSGLVPLRHLGTVTDVADAVAYLCSDAAGFVNGQELVVDGGFLETPLMHAQPPADQYGGRGPQVSFSTR